MPIVDFTMSTVEEVREMPTIEFLAKTPREHLVVTTRVMEGSTLWPIRRFILGRPFFALHEEGSNMVTFRCVVRRDEIAPGIRGWEGLRSVTSPRSSIEYTLHSIFQLDHLQEEWLRRSRSDYGEGLDLLDPEEVADEEEKVFAKVVKKLGKRFFGLWTEDNNLDDWPEDAVFLKIDSRKDRDGRISLNFKLVDMEGRLIEGAGNLFELVGDANPDSLGFLRLYSSIARSVPFELNSTRGSLVLR